MKRKLYVLFISTCGLSMALAGCGSGNSAPKDAADLLARYTSGSQDNYKMNLDVTMTLTMGAMGIDMEIPVTIGENIDVAGDYGHGTMDMSIDLGGLSSLLGMLGSDESSEEIASDTSASYEIYIDTSAQDTAVMYSAEAGSDEWSKSDTDIELFTTMKDSLLTDGVFDDATMTTDKDKKEYTVVMPFSSVLDNGDVGDALKESLSMFDSVGLTDEDTEDAMIDAFKDINMTYVFDNDLNLTSIKMDPFSYETSSDDSGIDYSITLDMTMDYTFSDFGSVKEEDVKVPSDIADAANDSGSFSLDDTESYMDSEDLEDELIASESDDSEPAGPVDFKAADDILGKVNGVELQAEGNDFSKTFGAIGFALDESEDGEYVFSTTTYSESDSVDLEVFNAARDTSTIADIEENGFAGYEISYYGDDGYKEAPPITWKNGITWGASADDVEAAYGTPDYKSEEDGTIIYQYQLSDQVEIEFFIYTEDYEYGTPGIGYVEVDVLNW